jgi:ribosome maturation factor RimP
LPFRGTALPSAWEDQVSVHAAVGFRISAREVAKYGESAMLNESDTAERVEALLQAPIAGLGFQLLEADFKFQGRWLLRLVIDSDKGINLVDCGAVSELAGRILDVEDPIEQEYSLEVTSPGVFRHLSTPRHFEQSVGKIFRCHLARGVMEERDNRMVRGKIEGVEGGEVVVSDGGESLHLPIDALRSARLDPDL